MSLCNAVLLVDCGSHVTLDDRVEEMCMTFLMYYVDGNVFPKVTFFQSIDDRYADFFNKSLTYGEVNPFTQLIYEH